MISPLFIGGLGMQEMLLIALVVLLFFGGKKIPELMKGLGKGVRSFKEDEQYGERDRGGTGEKRISGWRLIRTNNLSGNISTCCGRLSLRACSWPSCSAWAAFCFKEELFAVILAPKDADFITYRLLYSLGGLVTESGAPDFLVKLINTGLAGQFIIHMKAALCAGVLCASPYILYQLFRFVSPALYVNERKYVVQVVGGGYAMFALGAAVSYFLIFPLTFRFLGTYQVSGEVENMIALHPYISTLMTMVVGNGACF